MNTRERISDTQSVEGPSGSRFPSKARRITYRVVAVVVALWLLLFNVFGLMEVVLMWLPAETVAELVDDPGTDPANLASHRTHFMAIGIVSWTVVLSVFAQLRKPARRLGSLLLLTTMALGGTVVYAFWGPSGSRFSRRAWRWDRCSCCRVLEERIPTDPQSGPHRRPARVLPQDHSVA